MPQRSQGEPAPPCPVELVLFSAPDCCLCDQALTDLEALRLELRFTIRVVDISGDPELEARYRARIPVAEVGGRTAFKYRVDEERVRRLVVEQCDFSPPRFLLDEMLGRLARWLRVLGYDADWAGGRPDDELLAAAEAEGRLLLTRDTRLLERRAIRRGRVRAHFVRHDHLEDQLGQLREELGLAPVGPPRCLVCNSPLAPVSAEEARPYVPPYVAATQTSFRYCPYCRRVMWPGTHWEEMRKLLRDVGVKLDQQERAS